MADETDFEREQREYREGYDAYAKEHNNPTLAEIDEARVEGRKSGLVFGTGFGTSAGDVPLNVADTTQLNEAVAEAAEAEEADEGDGTITVDTQPGGTTQVAATPEAVEEASVENADAAAPAEATTEPTAPEETPAETPAPSADDDNDPATRNAAEVVADIKSAETVEDVDRLAAERPDAKTVQDAAKARKDQLASA